MMTLINFLLCQQSKQKSNQIKNWNLYRHIFNSIFLLTRYSFVFQMMEVAYVAIGSCLCNNWRPNFLPICISADKESLLTRDVT